MAQFNIPELAEIADSSEGIFAGSGAINDPTPTPPPLGQSDDCWTWACTWTGHNSGGHSVCNVTGTHAGRHSGDCLTLSFVTNFPISEVKNASGLTISDVGTYSFTLTRNNHFNPGESVGFNFEIVTSQIMYDEDGNPLHGAIGTKNADAYYCKVACTCNG